MRSLYALVTSLLLTAFVPGCSDAGDDPATLEAAAGDPARAEAQAKALPAPVSLRASGDVYGGLAQAWTWPVADVSPTAFLVRFEFHAAMPAPGYTLQDASVRLLDPMGVVQGEYRTALAIGQYQEQVLDFHVPPYAAVTPGNWSVELSAGTASMAHYLLEVTVDYQPVLEEAAAGADAGAT